MADPGAARFEASLAYLRERFVALRPFGPIAGRMVEEGPQAPEPPGPWGQPDTLRWFTVETELVDTGLTDDGRSGWVDYPIMAREVCFRLTQVGHSDLARLDALHRFERLSADADPAAEQIAARLGLPWQYTADSVQPVGALWWWLLFETAAAASPGCLLRLADQRVDRRGRRWLWGIRDVVEGSIMLIDAALAAPSPPPSPTPSAGQPEVAPPRRACRPWKRDVGGLTKEQWLAAAYAEDPSRRPWSSRQLAKIPGCQWSESTIRGIDLYNSVRAQLEIEERARADDLREELVAEGEGPGLHLSKRKSREGRQRRSADEAAADRAADDFLRQHDKKPPRG